MALYSALTERHRSLPNGMGVLHSGAHPLCHQCTGLVTAMKSENPDDVIKWKHFPRYWTFVQGFHRSPVNSRHKGQWRGALMFSLICAWINGWVNNHEAGALRRHRAQYDVIVISSFMMPTLSSLHRRDGTTVCRYDNQRCHQWRQSWHRVSFRWEG